MFVLSLSYQKFKKCGFHSNTSFLSTSFSFYHGQEIEVMKCCKEVIFGKKEIIRIFVLVICLIMKNALILAFSFKQAYK